MRRAKPFFTLSLVIFCQCFTHFAAKTSKIWLFHGSYNIKTPEKHSKNYLRRPVAAAVLIGIVLLVFYDFHWESVRYRTILAKVLQNSTFCRSFSGKHFYQNHQKHQKLENDQICSFNHEKRVLRRKSVLENKRHMLNKFLQWAQ